MTYRASSTCLHVSLLSSSPFILLMEDNVCINMFIPYQHQTTITRYPLNLLVSRVVKPPIDDDDDVRVTMILYKVITLTAHVSLPCFVPVPLPRGRCVVTCPTITTASGDTRDCQLATFCRTLLRMRSSNTITLFI